MSELIRFLERIEIFSGLPDEKLEKVMGLCQEVRYNTGDLVIKKGDPPDNFYLIAKGAVEVATAPDESDEAITDGVQGTLGTGQSVGELGLVDRGKRSASVRCTDDTTAYAINCKEFLDICEDDARLGYMVIRNCAVDL